MARDPDVQSLRVALTELPRTCRYHGDRLERDGQPWEPQYCCDTGRSALLRRRAAVALDRLEARLLAVSHG